MDKNKLELIKTQTIELISRMVDNFTVEVGEEGGVVQLTIKTDEEAPTIIGRHGETIRALQKILEVIIYRKLGENVDILVNVNDYRERQKERLQHIASEAAAKVQVSGSPSYLRGFSAYERKVMHEYITAKYLDLTTYSVGEGRDRRLVIDKKKTE